MMHYVKTAAVIVVVMAVVARVKPLRDLVGF
jgi:hypothetical protein